jgi:hypothetical protein
MYWFQGKKVKTKEALEEGISCNVPPQRDVQDELQVKKEEGLQQNSAPPQRDVHKNFKLKVICCTESNPL